jgi:long-chain acyl-CoA synthetase
MPEPLLNEARAKLNCGFAQGYGMTETSPVMTSLTTEDHDLRPEKLRSVGRPAVGCEVLIVDEHDNKLPRGQVGEIISRGANRMLGYWKRPQANQEVLRGGWMHSGDMGAMDEDGYVTLYDRKKDMIKPGGENVYSPEVESMILSHPAVLEAAVIGVPDPKWNEIIRAVVVLREAKQVTELELIAWCRERMTHFKCPSSVVFADVLPKGGTAKVQKNVLRERYGR